MRESWFELHAHTDYSNLTLIDCINKVENLIQYAFDLGLHGLAITDHEALCGHIKARDFIESKRKSSDEELAKKWKDFKLILGNEIYLCRNGLSESNFISGQDKFYHFILLAKDEIGHNQLQELSSRAWDRSWMKFIRRRPTYYSDIEDIVGKNPGHIVASTACLGGFLGTTILRYGADSKNKSKYQQEIIDFLNWCVDIFGEENFFLEMQPSNEEEQVFVNTEIQKISAAMDIPIIITTDAHYLKKEDRKIHKAYLNSKDGDREVDSFYASTYVMTAEEIHEYMDDSIGASSVSEYLSNTNLIADMCEDYSLEKLIIVPYIPLNDYEYLIKDRNYNISEYYSNIPSLKLFAESPYISDNHLAFRIVDAINSNKFYTQDDKVKDRLERIEVELNTLWTSSEKQDIRWSAYLLQESDYVKIFWEDSLVGPGRGSGVSFYLNYLLDICQIDPTREKAPMRYWRFINPERASILDIDVDIEGNKRNRIIERMQEVYGKEHVTRVCTFGTEKARRAIATACLAPGTLISTTDTIKPIEHIDCNDYVYTTNGIEKVITPTQRHYNGRLYHFNCSGIGEGFSVTHNHQLLVFTNRTKKRYNNICNYNKCYLIDPSGNILGDFISEKEAARYYANYTNGSFSSIYKYKTVNGYSIIKTPIIKNHNIQWLCADQIEPTDYLLSPIFKNNSNNNSFFFSKEEQNPYKKYCEYIPEEIPIDENLSELIGIYLAEGNINYNNLGITFTIHQNEQRLKERIIELVLKCFRINRSHIHVYYKKNNKGISIQVNSAPIGRWFAKYCSGYSYSKRVPENIMNADKSIQKKLLYGCFYGDGYGRRKNSSYEAKITSISYHLIQDLWQIAARNKYNCSITTERAKPEKNKKTVYNLMFYGKTAQALFTSKYDQLEDLDWEEQEYIEYNGTYYYKIKINNISSSLYDGEVYCLETQSHNYLLNNIVSHNCRGLGIDVDIAQYLGSMVASERGIQRTLSETFYGDEEKGIAPNKQFVIEMTDNYPEVWNVAQRIEGLVCSVGIHAGGVIITDKPIQKSCAIMRTQKGDIVSQYELHDAEKAGR